MLGFDGDSFAAARMRAIFSCDNIARCPAIFKRYPIFVEKSGLASRAESCISRRPGLARPHRPTWTTSRFGRPKKGEFHSPQTKGHADVDHRRAQDRAHKRLCIESRR